MKCKVEGCERKVCKGVKHGLCRGHRNESLGYKCQVNDCDSLVTNTKTSLCGKHDAQLIKYGKTLEKTRFDKNEVFIEGEICIIFIYDSNGKKKAEAIIDTEDYKKIKNYKWHLSNSAIKTKDENGKQLLVTHLIIGKKTKIDHIDRNFLNNRKNNLRLATHQQNNCNKGMSRHNSSGFKGVSWCKDTERWMAQISIKNKNMKIGRFDTIIEAAKAYDKAAIKHYGKFACTNKMLSLIE